MSIFGTLITVEWKYPSTYAGRAPGNGVFCMALWFTPKHINTLQQPPEIDQYWSPGCGYSVSTRFLVPLIKQLPPETLATLRRKRLHRRTIAKYPLLAEQIVAEELARKPAYYNGITDEKYDVPRRASLECERKIHEFLLVNAEQIVVWDQIPDFMRGYYWPTR
ncbi:MAG TPA: hypothetical protein VFF78_04950 [Anaerolineaceae bacterium]|nr:hypothetical protein [Anaerolineaceae bacterium]